MTKQSKRNKLLKRLIKISSRIVLEKVFQKALMMCNMKNKIKRISARLDRYHYLIQPNLKIMNRKSLIKLKAYLLLNKSKLKIIILINL